MEYFHRVILYFDGASRHNPHGPAGCGYQLVEMDEYGTDGCVILEGYKYLAHGLSNNQAEYEGLIEGLEMVSDNIDVDYLYIRGDSEIVIKQLEGDYQVRSNRISPHYNDALDLLEGLNVYDKRYKWIARHRNWRADQLANQAIAERDSGHIWWP